MSAGGVFPQKKKSRESVLSIDPKNGLTDYCLFRLLLCWPAPAIAAQVMTGVFCFLACNYAGFVLRIMVLVHLSNFAVASFA